MVLLPVAKLVRKDSLDFLLGALLKQSVVDDDLLLSNPGQAGEVGVAVGAALASINDLQLAEGEFELGSESLDRLLEFSGLQRLELVEEGNDEDGIDCHGRDLDNEHEDPEVVKEAVTSPFDNGQEGAADGDTECDGQGLALEHIGEP